MTKTVLLLGDNNFNEYVTSCELPLLIDCWASWCPPCKMVEPVLKDLAEILHDRVIIAKVNVDQNQKTAAELNVVGVPLFILFYKGKELCRASGARSGKQLIKMMEEAGISVVDSDIKMTRAK